MALIEFTRNYEDLSAEVKRWKQLHPARSTRSK